MSFNRVQKLLFSEYCDFEDMVLIESPFAQTTRDGTGIRQVHLGLTSSKLVLATDILPPVRYVNVNYAPSIDPEIETFELIAIYPVECVNLSIYRKKKKQTLKARFCNNKVFYFELGGFEKRAMFWNLWCERVKFLCPGNSASSRSETSVATSSSGSTLYILNKKIVTVNGTKQLWYRFGSGTLMNNNTIKIQKNLIRKWSDKHLYLGKEFEMGIHYQPIMHIPTIEELVKQKKSAKKLVLRSEHPSIMEEKELNFGDTVQINRFGAGIYEGCGSPLYLKLDDYIIPRQYSKILQEINSSTSDNSIINFNQLADSALLTWEFYRVNDPNKYRSRHRRRYGLAMQPILQYGFVSGSTISGGNYSLHMKQVVSEICIRKKAKELELILSLDKNLLKSSISHECFYHEKSTKIDNLFKAPKYPVTLFWTTGYQYRPKSAKESYNQLLTHTKNVQQYHEKIQKHANRKRNKKFFKKTKNIRTGVNDSEDESDETFIPKIRKKKHGFIYNMFSSKTEAVSEIENKFEKSSLKVMRKSLLAEITVTAWDLNSTILAEQLTMIEKELFLKISPDELQMLLWNKSFQNAPNICGLITFSYRITCLLASDILKNDTVKSRARLIARFINAANKCHRISNFQSCKTIVYSLQCPAIYRLKTTWAYLRKKHASKYQNFEILCRLYKDPRMANYQKTIYILSQNPPFLPYIGDIIAKLLGKIPEYSSFSNPCYGLSTFISSRTSSDAAIAVENSKKIPNMITKIYRAFVGSDACNKQSSQKSHRSSKNKITNQKTLKLKGLYEYYNDLDYSQDARFHRFEESKKLLEQGQIGAINYNFLHNELARTYLLKTRYEEEEKNFYNSIRIEPSHNYY